MARLFFLVFFFIYSVTATSPIINETDDSLEPGAKPAVSVPRRCPPNEVLKSKAPCPPDTCDMLYLSVLCIANQTESVVCTCKDGYLRTNSTATGVCVPQDRCLPPECADDPNAKRGCGNRCGKTCADYNDTSKVCNKNVCNLFGCDCQDGFVYDTNRKRCVKPKQCTKQCTKPHERYSNCLLGECRPKTCDDVGYPVPCPDIIGPCAGGCTCEEGFVRDCNGDCIDMKECPCCGGDPNAVSGCGNPCGKTCASLYANKSDLVCPQYCQYNGCDCKPGFLLLESNNTDSSKCVPESKCPKPPKCKGPHEKHIDCPAGQCNAKTCKDLIRPPPCPRVIPPCPGGCVCENGYLRNSEGICIKKELCPSVCKDPNASWTECMDACPRTCQNTNPGCVNVRCSAGCQCNTGYVLSKIGGKCVKIEECPDYANCSANQTFVPCTFKCPQVMCPESDQILLCKPPRDCPGGCGCKPYYRYNATGDCIKAYDCHPIECTGDNQVWTSCQRISDWERCEDRYNSPPINPGDPDDCTPKCVCKKGYWRNSVNECVTENECPP